MAGILELLDQQFKQLLFLLRQALHCNGVACPKQSVYRYAQCIRNRNNHVQRRLLNILLVAADR